MAGQLNTTLAGARLRERRLALGMRQADLAVHAGISPSYLNLIEHNRRRVTPEVLARLARALDADPQRFSEELRQGPLEELRAIAAAAEPGELERPEDLVARFPGWAGLAVRYGERVQRLEAALAALNDRLGHDPNLSSALHELISAISGVRATAAILAETDDLAPERQRRFHRNLHQDSERLAHGAEVLVGWLDRSETDLEPGARAPQDEFETWLSGRDWHLPELEAGGSPALLADEVERLASAGARALAMAHIAAVARDARAMPLATLRTVIDEHGADPAMLARHFGTTVLTVLRRLALLPGAEAGLVICDASGTLLFRKPTAGFTLPRFAAACPLWPLFAALARPGAPIEAHLRTPEPGGGLFRIQAFCETRLPAAFDGPELRSAAMLILPGRDAGARALAVGSTCRLCPRHPCPGRREPSILGEAR